MVNREKKVPHTHRFDFELQTPTSEKAKSFSVPKFHLACFVFPTFSQPPNIAYTTPFSFLSSPHFQFSIRWMFVYIKQKQKKWNFLGKQTENYIQKYINIYLVENQATWFVDDVEAVNCCHFKGQFGNMLNFWER